MGLAGPARPPHSGRWPDGQGLRQGTCVLQAAPSRSAASTTARPAALDLPASSRLETQAWPHAETLHTLTGHASTGA